ncbi:MAG: PilN domain-containing protein [Candidatus Hydrothermia bacterium]
MALLGQLGLGAKGKTKGSIVALDIGSKYVKAALFERRKNELVFRGLAVEKVPPDVILGKDIIDRQVLVDKIRDAYSKLGTEVRDVVVNVAGGEVKTKAFVIPDLKKKEKIAEAVDWKIKDELHVDPTEIVRDYELLGKSEVSESLDMLVGTAKLSVVYDIMDIVRAARLEPIMVTTDLLALWRVIEALDLKDLPGDNVFFHLGYEVGLLIHVKDGKIQQMIEVPAGLKSYVDNLSRFFDLRVEEAEEIVINGPTSGIDKVSFDETVDSLHERFLSPEKYIPLLGEPGVKFNLYISGGGSKLYGVSAFVKNKYGVDLKFIDVSTLFAVEEPVKGIKDYLNLLTIVIGDALHYFRKGHKINLMPQEAGMEAVAVEGEVSLLPHVVGALSIWLVIVIVIAVLSIGTSRRISGLKNQIARLQAEEVELQRKADEIRGFKQEIEDARRKLDLIQQLQMGRTVYVRLLDEINRVLPSGCWLESVRKSGSYLNVSGGALSNIRISQFMSNLKKSDVVDSVYLQSIEVSGGSQQERYARFEINVKLK